MTGRGALDAMYDKLIRDVAQTLEWSGSKLRGKAIKVISQGNAGIIEFQKSKKNSDQEITFTINVAVVCGDLIDPDGTSIEKATSVDAHWRDRLGMLLETRHDTWWQLTASTDCAALAQELSVLLLARAVPCLEQYLNTGALIALWESGQSPGLTAVQRSRFLTELNEKGSRGSK